MYPSNEAPQKINGNIRSITCNIYNVHNFEIEKEKVATEQNVLVNLFNVPERLEVRNWK